MATSFQLNPDQLAQIESGMTHGGEISERAKMICALHYSGRVATVAESCHSDPRVVRKWFKRFLKEGLDGLKDRKRSGRPKRIDDQSLSQLLVKIDDYSQRLTLRELSRQTGLATSTIHRNLKMVGLTLHDSARELWQCLGAEPSGWMEFCGLAASNHEQLMVFAYHPKLDGDELAAHAQNGGLGCYRHGLIGDPVRMFEVSDREHAFLWDDTSRPFDTARGWLKRLPTAQLKDLHCLVWRPEPMQLQDLDGYAASNPGITIHPVNSRRNWARLVDPIFLYERRGSKRVRNTARCWWRLTSAALNSLPAIQWTPGFSKQSRRFSHYSGDYYSPMAAPDTDVNDLFESLLVAQSSAQRRRKVGPGNDEWDSPIL